MKNEIKHTAHSKYNRCQYHIVFAIIFSITHCCINSDSVGNKSINITIILTITKLNLMFLKINLMDSIRYCIISLWRWFIMSISYNKLWKLLIDRNMNKSELRTQAKISTNAIAKMGKNEPVSMDTMDKICKALHCNIGDVMDFVADDETICWLSVILDNVSCKI